MADAVEEPEEPATDARTTCPVDWFHTKMFEPFVDEPDVLPVFRLLAFDSNATKLPLLLIEGFMLSPFGAMPF